MPMSREELQQMDRRGEERVKLVDSACQMTHRTKVDFNMTVNVVDLTYFGLLLEAGSEANAAAILAEPRDLSIHLPSVDSEGNVSTERLSIECLIFEQVGTQVRALLKHGNFETSDRLSAMLASRAVIRD